MTMRRDGGQRRRGVLGAGVDLGVRMLVALVIVGSGIFALVIVVSIVGWVATR